MGNLRGQIYKNISRKFNLDYSNNFISY